MIKSGNEKNNYSNLRLIVFNLYSSNSAAKEN